MTPAEIRSAISGSPELTALVPNTQAIAEALSQNRQKLTHTEIGNGTILEVLGMEVGNTLLDLIYSNQLFRHVKPLIEQGRLRLDSPLVLAMLQSLVGTVLTQTNVNDLKSRASIADPVSELEVRAAIFNDDGTLRV